MRNGTYLLMLIGRVYNTPLHRFTQHRVNIFFWGGGNVDSLCIPSFSLTLSFLSFCLGSFLKNGHVKYVEKKFHRLNIYWNIVLFIYGYFLFDSRAFCAPFLVLRLNISSD